MKIIRADIRSNGDVVTTFMDKNGNLEQHTITVNDMSKFFSGNPNKAK